jgi:putative RecB family exonuclease
VDRIKVPQVKTVEMFRGSQVHAALETLYRRVQRGRAPSVDEILDGYRRAWQAQWAPEIVVSDPSMTPDDFLRQGEQDLVTYDARYRPFDGDRTVEVESRIMLSLDPARRISLQGFVDRLSIARDGVWQIHDYKTGRRLPTQQDLDEDRQLALYQIGVQRRYPWQTERVELVWHYLAFDQEMRSSRVPEALRELERRTLALIDVIQADVTFETRVGHHCRTCTYQAMCPAWSHQFRHVALPELARQMELTEVSEEETVAFPAPAGPKRSQAQEVLDVPAAIRLYRSAVWPEYFRRILAPFLNKIKMFSVGLRKR